MHIQTSVSAYRGGAVPPTPAPENAMTLQDLFLGQPTECLAAGEALFWEGGSAGQIFDVVKGVLRVYRILQDGRRGVTGFIYPGDVLGVSYRDRYVFTAEAVTEVKVRRFSRTRFFALVDESPALRPQLFALLCDEMSAAQDQMILLGRKSAEERVVSFLLAVQRKSADGNEIELPMGRQDIADYLGLTIETVSRTMTSLARRELIGTSGRHSVTLRKLATLRKISGSDDGAEVTSTRRAVWPH